MRRILALAILVSFIIAGVSLAEEYTGKIKALDVKKREVTISVGDKETTLPIDKDVSVFYEAKAGKKKGQGGGLEPVPGGLSGLKTGNAVTLTTETKKETETVTLIQLNDPVADAKPKK